MRTMNMKGLMAGISLAILILTTTAAAEPFNSAFSTVYGQVTDGGVGINGANVSLTANGVTMTMVTITNDRGENGFYLFELANIPNVLDTTPLTLNVTSGIKFATTTITMGGNAIQQVDLAVQTHELATINVIPPSLLVLEGTNSTFAAVRMCQHGAPITVNVTWNSSNTTVGTINSTGVFTALVAGTTTITAANGSVSGNASVTVISATPALNTISVTPPVAFVVVGGNQTFTAATLDQFGNPINATVTWSSSNTSVGTVDPVTGVFTVVSTGTSLINATNGTVVGSASVTVTVISASSKLSMIAVEPPLTSLVVGETHIFTVVTRDQFGNPIDATVTWSSSNPWVGTIDPVWGVFTAKAQGTTMITATNGTVSSAPTANEVIVSWGAPDLHLVPALTQIGVIALAGLLSFIAVRRLRTKR